MYFPCAKRCKNVNLPKSIRPCFRASCIEPPAKEGSNSTRRFPKKVSRSQKPQSPENHLKQREEREHISEEPASSSPTLGPARKRRGGGAASRWRQQRTEEQRRGRSERAARASFDSVKRTAAPQLHATGPHRAPHRYGWLCKQDGRKVDRIARSRVTIIYLPAGPERRVYRANTYPPAKHKDPHAGICMEPRTFYARAPSPPSQWERASVSLDEDRFRVA